MTTRTTKPDSHKLLRRSSGLLVLLVLGAAAAAEVKQPAPPKMTLNDGKLLVKLARSGMLAFVKSRTSAEKFPIEPKMKHLTEMLYPACVTLRSSGRLMSRSFRADTNVHRSVLSAALEAMRSDKLPDRITPSVLAALTIEVEVQGPQQAVSHTDLTGRITPGLTGVRVARGTAKGYMLPSMAVPLGASPEQIQGLCLAQLPATTNTAGQRHTWTIFRTRHFVGYPDGVVVRLFRGKVLLPPENLTAETLADAAAAAGLFLVARQGADGAYSTSNAKPTLHEHLYATYALAKLSSRRGGGGDGDGDKIFSASVNRALAYAAKFVRADDKQARVIARSSGGQTAESPTRATAWMLMAISELPPDASNRKLSEKLAAALQQDVVSVVGPDHGLATPNQLRDWSVAMLALRKFLPKNKSTAKLLDPLRKTMRAWSQSGQKLSPLILRSVGGVTNLPKWRQIDDSDIPDRRGGFVSSGSEPTTLDTANAAVCLAESLKLTSMPQQRQAAVKKQILRARQFCRQMLYQSREAYRAAKPVKMLGGLRRSPAGGAVSLEACAAAIEAFLVN